MPNGPLFSEEIKELQSIKKEIEQREHLEAAIAQNKQRLIQLCIDHLIAAETNNKMPARAFSDKVDALIERKKIEIDHLIGARDALAKAICDIFD